MPSDVTCKGFNLGFIRIINTPSYPVHMEHSFKRRFKNIFKTVEYLKDVLKTSFERCVHRVKLILSSQGITFKAFKFIWVIGTTNQLCIRGS